MVKMFIQCLTEMDEIMSVTFNDIKAKNKKLTERLWELREKLQNEAARLVSEYSDSLSLTNDVWRNSRGEDRPYIQIGIMDNDKKFTPEHVARLRLDEDYYLRFVLATTVDDTPLTGGQIYCVSIALWHDNFWLNASVGSGQAQTTFRVSERPGGFSETCTAIKSLICNALDESMPLWKS